MTTIYVNCMVRPTDFDPDSLHFPKVALVKRLKD